MCVCLQYLSAGPLASARPSLLPGVMTLFLMYQPYYQQFIIHTTQPPASKYLQRNLFVLIVNFRPDQAYFYALH